MVFNFYYPRSAIWNKFRIFPKITSFVLYPAFYVELVMYQSNEMFAYYILLVFY